MKTLKLIPRAPVGVHAVLAGLVTLLFQQAVVARPNPHWMDHDRRRPQPRVVDPGTFSTQEKPGRPPSDAVVLFNGHGLSHWCAVDGSPTQWVVKDGAMQCIPGSGSVRTRECFGDCQLHVEFATPNPPKGEGQARGNSGVFFGLDRYEVQVLDSYHNKTYADGSASAVYGQYPPLVNASRPPGQWQTYDLIWTAPRFSPEGDLLSRAHLTVFHNGVLVQNNVALTGPTGWLTRAPYKPHPVKLPISFQDHENPIRYRNIWVRPLGHPGRKEFMLADALLDTYTGDYQGDQGMLFKIRRAHDGLLALSFRGATFLMHAQSHTHFFATTTDVQCDFHVRGKNEYIVVSVGEGGMKAKKVWHFNE